MSCPGLEVALRRRREQGGKSLVPYLTGGLGDWTTILLAAADAGADAIEVGIPFSDPVMDGPVIQQANDLALAAGATPPGILDALSGLDAGVPLRSVSGRVGHRNPSTTTNIYAHWIQESDARSAEVVEGRIWESAERGQP